MAGANVILYACSSRSSVRAVRTGERFLSCVSSVVNYHVASNWSCVSPYQAVVSDTPSLHSMASVRVETLDGPQRQLTERTVGRWFGSSIGYKTNDEFFPLETSRIWIYEQYLAPQHFAFHLVCIKSHAQFQTDR